MFIIFLEFSVKIMFFHKDLVVSLSFWARKCIFITIFPTPYVYFDPYVYCFSQIFHPVCLFGPVRLFGTLEYIDSNQLFDLRNQKIM